ncbi:MAG: metalloregulator ArsR/SmtB family transcription factor [Myxococcota bacterium]
MRALANTERRELLRLCLDAPMSAGDLAQHFSLALASVSEHLKVLRKTGLVDVQKSGRHWMYQANRPALDALLHRLEAFFNAQAR